MLNFLAAIGSAPGGGGGSFESIATATITSNTASVTFSSIPSGFQHLQLRYFALTTTTNAIKLRLNNDSGASYRGHYLYGNGASAAAAADGSLQTKATVGGVLGGGTSTLGVAGIIDLHDYTSSTKNKVGRIFSGVDKNGSGNINLDSFFWNNTNAINRIDLDSDSGSNFASGSTFALYGIKGA